MKFFKGRDVKVQVATPGKDGQGFTTAAAPLAEEHVTGARDYGDRVAIVTIDGQRYEAAKKADKAA